MEKKLQKFGINMEQRYKIFYKKKHIRHKTMKLGAKGDWDFRISDLVKNTNGNDI